MTLGLLGVNPVCRLAISIARQNRVFDRILLFDDDAAKLTQHVDGCCVVGTSEDIEQRVQYGDLDALSICIGSKHLPRKKMLFERYRAEGVNFARLIHPAAVVDPSAIVKDGCVLGPCVVIGLGTRIEEDTLIWSGSVIEHDSVVGGHSYIGPNASISGFVRIGECTLVGTGAVVLPEVRIGSCCVLGAGAVVTKDVADCATVVGVPAR